MIPQDKLKDVLITRTAIKTLKPEQIVEKVISFQFKDAREFTKHVDEVEISGFGKFIRSRAKTRRKLKQLKEALVAVEKNMQDITRSEEQMKTLRGKQETLKASIEFLEQKTNKDENRLSGDSRGDQK